MSQPQVVAEPAEPSPPATAAPAAAVVAEPTAPRRGPLSLARLLRHPVDSPEALESSALVVGAEVTAGYADVDVFKGDLFGVPADASAQALSATFAIPIALSVRSGNVTVAPLLVPRFGYGRTKDMINVFGERTDDTFAGGRFMLGGSVMVRFGDRVGFDAGLQKVFIDQGETAYGVGVSVGF